MYSTLVLQGHQQAVDKYRCSQARLLYNYNIIRAGLIKWPVSVYTFLCTKVGVSTSGFQHFSHELSH